MENATKALLIAAAVLIAILLISLGVGVFNTASEQMSGADLTEYEVQRFNDKFKQYEGKNVSGSEANALLDTVFNHNLVQEDDSTRVTVGSGDTSNDSTDVLKKGDTSTPTKYSTGKRFTVTCVYDSNSKLVTHIKVEENKTKTTT